MNKHVAVKSTNSTPAKAKPWPSQTQVVELASGLDRVAKHAAKFKSLLRVPAQYMPLEEAENATSEYEGTGCKNLAARLDDQWNVTEPEDWRDEDGNVNRQSVTAMMAMLVGSFPTSNLPDAPVFTRVMLEDVLAADPCFVELESTCRQLRHSQKFMPSISEVMTTLHAEKKRWLARYEALSLVKEDHAELKQRIAAERERRNAEAERRAALAVPLAIGSEVEHMKFGRGIVVDFDGAGVLVKFGAEQRKIVASFLETAGRTPCSQ